MNWPTRPILDCSECNGTGRIPNYTIDALLDVGFQCGFTSIAIHRLIKGGYSVQLSGKLGRSSLSRTGPTVETALKAAIAAAVNG